MKWKRMVVGVPNFSKKGIYSLNVSWRSASVQLYLRIYVVVVRHYAHIAEGLVHLQKAVLSTHTFSNNSIIISFFFFIPSSPMKSNKPCYSP